MTKKDLTGRKVRTLCKLTCGMMEIPEGSILEIRTKSSGLNLSSPKCNHCGVRVFIAKVGPEDVELLPE